MNLKYSTEQQLLADSAHRFLTTNYDFSVRQKIVAGDIHASEKSWIRFAELGWLGLPFTEADGGFEGSETDLSIVLNALGAALVVEPYIPTVVLGARAVMLAGTESQRQVLAHVAAGDIKMCFAHNESKSNGDLSVVETKATQKDKGWEIEGTKTIVLGGGEADYIVVSARVSGEINSKNGIGLFLVPKNIKGLEIKSYYLTDGSQAATLSFRDVSVEKDCLLGATEKTFDVIEEIFDRAASALCSYIVGGLRKLIAETHGYVSTRVQFGRPLIKFQVIEHRLAEMLVAYEEARAIANFSTVSLSSSRQLRMRAVSAAKVKVGDSAKFIAHQAVQLHGGMGVTEELSVATYLKAVTVFNLLYGTPDQHRRRYERLMTNGAFATHDSLAYSIDQ